MSDEKLHPIVQTMLDPKAWTFQEMGGNMDFHRKAFVGFPYELSYAALSNGAMMADEMLALQTFMANFPRRLREAEQAQAEMREFRKQLDGLCKMLGLPGNATAADIVESLQKHAMAKMLGVNP